MGHVSSVSRGKLSLIVGGLAFLVGLYALITAGNLPLFTIGTSLFIAGFIGKVMNNDVIDVFVVGIVVIGILVFGLYKVESKLSSGHAKPAAAEKSH